MPIPNDSGRIQHSRWAKSWFRNGQGSLPTTFRASFNRGSSHGPFPAKPTYAAITKYKVARSAPLRISWSRKKGSTSSLKFLLLLVSSVAVYSVRIIFTDDDGATALLSRSPRPRDHSAGVIGLNLEVGPSIYGGWFTYWRPSLLSITTPRSYPEDLHLHPFSTFALINMTTLQSRQCLWRCIRANKPWSTHIGLC